MHRRTRRVLAPAVLLVGAALLGTAGCSSSSSNKVSSEVSAAESLASRGAGAANSIASQAASGASALSSLAGGLSSSAASAEAAASSAMAKVKGLDASGDVKLGSVSTGSDGHTDVPLTVTNHQTQAQQYTIQVDFKDSTGKLLDVAVVSVPSVAAGQSAQATARSTHTLSGTVTASVANAVRY